MQHKSTWQHGLNHVPIPHREHGRVPKQEAEFLWGPKVPLSHRFINGRVGFLCHIQETAGVHWANRRGGRWKHKDRSGVRGSSTAKHKDRTMEKMLLTLLLLYKDKTVFSVKVLQAFRTNFTDSDVKEVNYAQTKLYDCLYNSLCLLEPYQDRIFWMIITPILCE